MLRNQDRPMIAFVLQSARKKDFAIAKVREGAAGGQMLRLSKEFESVNQGSATYGPRAGSGPPNKIIRPAALLQILVIELCGLA